MITRQNAGCNVQREEGLSPPPQQGHAKRNPHRTLIYRADSISLGSAKPIYCGQGAIPGYKSQLKSPAHGAQPSQLGGKHLRSKDTSLATSALQSILVSKARLQNGGGSAENSPKCVIRNSALHSNSSSPTLSTLSKASSEMDRTDYPDVKSISTGNCSSDGDDEAFYGDSPRDELPKGGCAHGVKKSVISTPGRQGLKGALSQRSEKDLSSSIENGWATVHEVGHALHLADNDGEVAFVTKKSLNLRDAQSKEAQTAPFKAVQSSMMEKGEETKKKYGGLASGTARPAAQVASVPNGSASIFSFNSSHAARSSDSEPFDYESSFEKESSASFDFNRAGGHRTVVGPLLKPTPSKWDDAEKWLSASEVPIKSKSRSGPLQAHIVATQAGVTVSKKVSFSTQGGRPSGIQNGISHSTKSTSVNCGVDAPSSGENSGEGEDHSPKTTNQRQPGERTKKVDTTKYIASQGEGAASRFAFMPAGKARSNTSLDRYPLNDQYGRDHDDTKEGSTSPEATDDTLSKPTLRTAKPTSESPTKDEDSPTKVSELPKPSQSTSPNEASAFVASALNVRSISMRDMGTEMTPIASVEPSRTATPLRATTPNLRSPTGSRPSTPGRTLHNSTPTSDSNCGMEETEPSKVLSGKELQAKTRQEILALGTQLGKANIAAWATKEEEEADAAKSLKASLELEEVRKNVLATRAAAWEEAEHAKYVARFNREETKIQAWENHEKAKAEAEMRRIEVKVERMRSHGNERLMNKLAATRRRAEDLRAAAEARRGEQAAKTAGRAEIIRRTGKIPGALVFRWCH